MCQGEVLPRERQRGVPLEVRQGQWLRRESPPRSPLCLIPTPLRPRARVQLTQRSTGEEVARHAPELVKDGYFKGERQWTLKVRPGCDLDIDIIVLTFVVLEKRRREKLAKQGPEESGADPVEGGIEMSS